MEMLEIILILFFKIGYAFKLKLTKADEIWWEAATV